MPHVYQKQIGLKLENFRQQIDDREAVDSRNACIDNLKFIVRIALRKQISELHGKWHLTIERKASHCGTAKTEDTESLAETIFRKGFRTHSGHGKFPRIKIALCYVLIELVNRDIVFGAFDDKGLLLKQTQKS